MAYSEFSLPHPAEDQDIRKERNRNLTVIKSANTHEHSFEMIENRITADKKRIVKTCAKYRNSINQGST